MTTESNQNLTPEGRRLADALVKAMVISPSEADPVRAGLSGRIALNTAAALLLTAPEREGAGLREALFGKIAEARRYADREGFGHATLCLPREDTDVLLSALTKPPAAQEPAAAGVVGPGIQGRKRCFIYCGDGICTCQNRELTPEESRYVMRALLSSTSEVATLTPPAPKTPDAATGGSVRDGGLRVLPFQEMQSEPTPPEEAKRLLVLHVKTILADLLLKHAPQFDCDNAAMADAFTEADIIVDAALARTVPVGEDETGVRGALRQTAIALARMLGYFDNSAFRLKYPSDADMEYVIQSGRDALAAGALQPPKAETPAGEDRVQRLLRVVYGVTFSAAAPAADGGRA